MKKFHHYKQGSAACASTSTQEVIRLSDSFKLMKVDHRVEMPSSHFKTLFFPIPWITQGIIPLYSFKDERIRYCLLLWLVIGHKV